MTFHHICFNLYLVIFVKPQLSPCIIIIIIIIIIITEFDLAPNEMFPLWEALNNDKY